MQINGINLGLLNFTNVNKLIKKRSYSFQVSCCCLFNSPSLFFFFSLLRRLRFQSIPSKLILALPLPSPSLLRLCLSPCLPLSVCLPLLPIYHILNVPIIIVSSLGYNTVSFLSFFSLPSFPPHPPHPSSPQLPAFSLLLFWCWGFFSPHSSQHNSSLVTLYATLPISKRAFCPDIGKQRRQGAN